MGLSWGRKKREVHSSNVAALAAAVTALVSERRASEMDTLLLDAALSTTGATGGRLTRASGSVVTKGKAARPQQRLISCDMSDADTSHGTIEVWGDTLVDDDVHSLAVLAGFGAQALSAAEGARQSLQAEVRRRRIGQAAAEIAGAGGRAEGLSELLARARQLLSAALAAVLVPGSDGTFQAALEDGLVAAEGHDAWSDLPPEVSLHMKAGKAWFGECASGAVAVAPLSHGDAHYGALGLAGFADAESMDRAFVTEFAERASAAIWIGSLEEEVRELSTVDPVTRLYDGRYFRQRLDQEINRAAREGAPLSVLVLGLDGSEDLRAHGRDAAADDALLDLAVHVGHTRRAMDVACRLAGDEIAMILPGAAGLDAVLVAERVRAAAGAIASQTGLSRVSVGIATFPECGPGREETISAGRLALGFARSYGGDRVFLYDREVASLLKAEQNEKIAGDDAFVATVYALAAAVDARDPSTCEHSQSVARIAAGIARELGLSSTHVEQIRTAGLLHDVGKIGVSDRVLRKSGPLTDDEWEEMRQHPLVAHRILAGTRLENIRPWILHHHERLDGAGYPEGLAGDSIPLEARIISVAEALDAMVQGRPWRAPMSVEDAMQEITSCMGSKFDPAVVGALQALAGRGEPGVLPRPGTQ